MLQVQDTCAKNRSRQDKAGPPQRGKDISCSAMSSRRAVRGFLLHYYPSCKGTRSIPMGIKCPKGVEGISPAAHQEWKIVWGVCYPAGDYPPERRWQATSLHAGTRMRRSSQGRRREPDLPQVSPPIVVAEPEEWLWSEPPRTESIPVGAAWALARWGPELSPRFGLGPGFRHQRCLKSWSDKSFNRWIPTRTD